MYFTTTLLFLAQSALVYSHARVNSPPIRSPGQNFLAACGQTSFDSVKGDPTGHIEEQEPVPSTGCELTLCRGMLFSDQPSTNVQTVTPGQSMSMSIDCTIPHGGPANVSLLDVTGGGNGQPIGSFLATFDNFCPTSGPTPANQTNLQYNLPDAATVGNKCQNAGDCVVQLFWATPDFTQNYYYCVDVAMAAASVPTVASSSLSLPSSSISQVIESSPTPTSSGFTTAFSSSPLAASQTAGAPATSQSSAARRRARLLWF